MGIYSTLNTNYSANLIDLDTIKESTHPLSIAGGIECVIENEQNYNRLMKIIAVAELNHFEATGEEMVYTEGAVGDFFKRLKEFFKKILAKIAALFKKFITMLDGFTKSDKDFFNKYKKQLANPNIPSDIEMKGFKFTHLDWKPEVAESDEEDKLNGLFDKKLAKISTTNKKGNTGERDATKDEIDTAIERYNDPDSLEDTAEQRRGLLLTKKNKSISSEDFASEIFKYFRNDEDSKQDIAVKDLFDDALSHLQTSDKLKKNAKTTYDNIEKKINAVIKSLDTKEKQMINKIGTNEYDAQALKIIQIKSNYAKTDLNILSTIYSGQLQALKDKSRQCKALCVKVITKKSVKESYGVEHYTESFLSDVEFN